MAKLADFWASQTPPRYPCTPPCPNPPPSNVYCYGESGALKLYLLDPWNSSEMTAPVLDIGIWKQPGTDAQPGASMGDLINPALRTYIIGDDTNETIETYRVYDPLNEIPWEFVITLEIPNAALTFPDCYYVRVRMYDQAAEQTPLTYVGGFTADAIDNNTMAYPYLTSLNGAWTSSIPFHLVGSNDGPTP